MAKDTFLAFVEDLDAIGHVVDLGNATLIVARKELANPWYRQALMKASSASDDGTNWSSEAAFEVMVKAFRDHGAEPDLVKRFMLEWRKDKYGFVMRSYVAIEEIDQLPQEIVSAAIAAMDNGASKSVSSGQAEAS